MEPEHAQELLTRERGRIEQALGLHTGPALEGDAEVVAGDDDGADLYQDSIDEGRRRDLEEQLSAVDRAEKRLADGTFGLSIQSGEPIPDGRLEAHPTAELTVEEQRAAGG